ncbi:UNVERIFIED_CONTAM: hypothetical protein GTU68_025161 [Idotea baltica]|nr:hypothetical protein [Idotea baltica]
MLPMFIMIFLIFYFLVHAPQSKKLKEHQSLLDSLKKGQNVVTDSGIIARVAGIEKDYILLDIANNTKIKVEKAHIAKIAE